MGGQSRMLTIVAENEGITQRQLAEIMDVRPASMTVMIGKMELFGLIERKQDAKDQRVMHIYITDSGRKAEEESRISTQQLVGSLFQSLSDEEVKQMLMITEKLSKSLNEGDSGDLQCRLHDHHRHHGFHKYYHESDDNLKHLFRNL
ncbi:MarR family transcriptional regulator [Clostridium sp. AWRP]|uniref:MarR family winged helix-turn-helix transcriptional regulator n=1 Tax=Clostridium sp. AWRP TaxID=2212991 RepID=UPI0015865628|nr:MarR family transcriptional regulator [Clostridium sp. AWRP]